MKLAELYTAIATDFPINQHDLLGESIKTTTLWITYIQFWSNENLQLEKLQSNRSVLISEKRTYYSGNASAEVYKNNPWNGISPKTENGIRKLIDADLEVIKYDENTLVQKQKVMILESCLDEVKRRGFAIKTAVDHLRFINGG